MTHHHFVIKFPGLRDIFHSDRHSGLCCGDLLADISRCSGTPATRNQDVCVGEREREGWRARAPASKQANSPSVFFAQKNKVARALAGIGRLASDRPYLILILFTSATAAAAAAAPATTHSRANSLAEKRLGGERRNRARWRPTRPFTDRDNRPERDDVECQEGVSAVCSSKSSRFNSRLSLDHARSPIKVDETRLDHQLVVVGFARVSPNGQLRRAHTSTSDLLFFF